MSVTVESHLGPWTIEDVQALPDRGNRYELLSPGVLTVTPAPGVLHQRASFRLAKLLEAAADDGVEVLEYVNLVITGVPGGRLLIPDIVTADRTVTATGPTWLQPEALRLAVEIVSPSSAPYDRLLKPEIYAQAGIARYWRFELEPEPHIVAHELRDGRYVPVAAAGPGRHTPLYAPFQVDVDPTELVRP